MATSDNNEQNTENTETNSNDNSPAKEDSPVNTEKETPSPSVELDYLKKQNELLQKQLNELKSASDQKNKSESNLVKDELERLKQENLKLKNEFTNKEKMSVMEQTARKHGLKENYLAQLNRLVDFDQVSLDNEFAPEIAIEQLKRNMPDLFGATNASAQMPVPTNTQDMSVMTRDKAIQKVKELWKERKVNDAQHLVDKYNINKAELTT